MLADVYKSIRSKADLIEWKKMNVNDLFRECIAHEDKEDYESYFSALVCRWWGYAGRLYIQCNRHVSYEECYDCIIDSLRYVLTKRVWENEKSSLYGDPTAPDKAMHIAMKRQRSIMLSKLSANKRQSNFNTLSIDGAHEEYADSADGLLFNINTSEDNCKRLISSYFGEDRETYLEGMLLDTICYSPYSKDIYQATVSRLKEIDPNCFDYYNDTYDAKLKIFQNTLLDIKKTSNKLLLVKLKRLLKELRLVYTA